MFQLHVPDPDGLAKEFEARGIAFFTTISGNEKGDDGLRGFELMDADGCILFFGRPDK
jgi:hypothetical protein